MKTHEGVLLGGWVRRFLVEHLVVERNLSRNTQRSYRDTLRLLIPFAADHHKTAVDRLVVTEVSADVVRGFLRHVEERRGCGVRTRNQRLAQVRHGNGQRWAKPKHSAHDAAKSPLHSAFHSRWAGIVMSS